MATRCIIKVEGVDYAKVFKYWDGYPEDMLPWLKEFNQDFTENREGDPAYKFAQLLRSSVRLADKYNLDPDKYTGWGVVHYNEDYGVDYEYTLHEDGSVTYK